MNIGTLIVRVVGVICLLAAISLTVVAPIFINRETAAVQALAPLDIPALEQQQPGTAVLVEGRISLDMPAEYNIYAAYWLQKPTGNRNNRPSKSDEWETETIVTPPLLLDVSGEPARVINKDYNLGWVNDWQDLDTEAGPRRIGGLRVGDPVLAIATLRSNSDGVRLEASVVTRGTKESYLAGQRISWWICVGLGAVCALAGIVLLSSNIVWNARRKKRRS